MGLTHGFLTTLGQPDRSPGWAESCVASLPEEIRAQCMRLTIYPGTPGLDQINGLPRPRMFVTGGVACNCPGV